LRGSEKVRAGADRGPTGFRDPGLGSREKEDIVKGMDKAADVLKEIESAPDSGIPDNIMGDAKCIAVIPCMVKVAIGFGGSHGKGVATSAQRVPGALLRQSQ
jgi:SH3 domain-containing YSC84-like protein 1